MEETKPYKKWIIEYWNPLKEEVECFNCDQGIWEEAPERNVTYIYVNRPGIYPAANPDKIYTTTMVGLDCYFWREEIDGTFVYGGWMETEKDGDGVLCYWYPDRRWQDNKTIKRRPDFIDDEEIKTGIWVEEPWASRLGLSGELDIGPARRVVQGCM